MASGEYTSVRAQSEALHAELAIERAEIARRPKAEEAELARIYRKRGLDPQLAHEVARQLSRDADNVWKIHAREELGVDPDDLPSPYLAAGSSFVAFAVGALVPLLPYFFGATTLLWSLVLTAVALFAAGTAVAALTARSWVFAGSRQLALGVVAAGISYGVGLAVGSAA
jgi:VIT1/CCC1 family predicted Fe2+/Mn2+ transporter